MSIKEKLPKAPHGYEWVSEIYASENETQVYLHLETAYIAGLPPRVPESYSATYEFCKPDEKSVVLAAARILEKFEESTAKRDRIDERLATESKKYADLIIRPGED